MGGGPLGQSQSFFFLVMVGEGLGDLWVRGRTSAERSGFFCSGLFTHIFICPTASNHQRRCQNLF